MGLAASQARLLTITARKTDCEFQSMSLSHQKLSLARDMEKVSNDYQDALAMTKLVYDYYGSGSSDVALTYGLLMTPSANNDYFPKLVTDPQNRIILSTQYARAAKIAGIPAEGLTGMPSEDVRNRFIEALTDVNLLTATTAAAIKQVPYCDTLGESTAVNTKTNTVEITYEQLYDLLGATTDNVTNGTKLVMTKGYDLDSDGGDEQGYKLVEKIGNASPVIIHDDDKQPALTVDQLLENDIHYAITRIRSKGHGSEKMVAALQDGLLAQDGILKWIHDSFAEVLGGTDASNAALSYAYQEVYNIVKPNNSNEIKNVGGKDDTSTSNTAYRDAFNEAYADEKLGLATSQMGNKNNGSDNEKVPITIDLNNLTQVFLTAYVHAMSGYDTNYYYKIGDMSECNLYDPNNDDFMFEIVTETEVEEQTQLYANFYDTLFNRLCLNGWSENDQITDAAYMTELMKNGMAYISSINDGGKYTQSSYSADRTVLEVADSEAIARAEARYNTEKAKIQNKEDTLDLKLKNLDTEISSLTTEYDTTKSIITKAIEKSFKRYDA